MGKAEIVDDLESPLEPFRLIANDLTHEGNSPILQSRSVRNVYDQYSHEKATVSNI